MQPEQPPSLYERLGRVDNVATVVDDLINRVMTDARLNMSPAVDEAHHRVSPAVFEFSSPRWCAGGGRATAALRADDGRLAAAPRVTGDGIVVVRRCSPGHRSRPAWLSGDGETDRDSRARADPWRPDE